MGVLPFPGIGLGAQTVGPEIIVRDGALSGAASETSAVFELGSSYIAWSDTRDSATSGRDIYVQKLGPDGAPLWGANGLPTCTAARTQSLPVITADGSGGAVVVWLDMRSNTNAIYGQRISADGAMQWAQDGVFVGFVFSEQPRPFVHRALNDEFLVTWWDSALFFISDDRHGLLAQKLAGDGSPQWDPGDPDQEDTWGPGIEVFDGITRGRSVPDGTGGFIAMAKIRQGGGFRYQRVLSDQSFAWPTPVDFDAELSDNVLFNFAADGRGGIAVSFIEGSSVRAVRVANDGSMPWGPTASTLVTSNIVTVQLLPIVSDGQGGAFIAWNSSFPRDVHIQHVAPDGAHLWPEGGAVVPDRTNSEGDSALVADAAGGLFLSFETSTSLRAQRLDRLGAAQWMSDGSNGLSLMSGTDPIIGMGAAGPVVVHSRSGGLLARVIEVVEPVSFEITSIVILPDQRVSLTVAAGLSGSTYDVLRAAGVGASGSTSWEVVGMIRANESWTDTNPPLPVAFYVAREP
jgi:hypothetical protein